MDKSCATWAIVRKCPRCDAVASGVLRADGTAIVVWYSPVGDVVGRDTMTAADMLDADFGCGHDDGSGSSSPAGLAALDRGGE